MQKELKELSRCRLYSKAATEEQEGKTKNGRRISQSHLPIYSATHLNFNEAGWLLMNPSALLTQPCHAHAIACAPFVLIRLKFNKYFLIEWNLICYQLTFFSLFRISLCILLAMKFDFCSFLLQSLEFRLFSGTYSWCC